MIPPAVEVLLRQLREQDPGGVLGAYLYGSGATTGLRPDSDVDVLVVTQRRLTDTERSFLVSSLLDVSGWRGHGAAFPDAVDRRPIEMTSLVRADLDPLPVRPRRDFQYGEWLRAQYLAGCLPRPSEDPDVVVLLATALSGHRVLLGLPLRECVPPVTPTMLVNAQSALVPRLLDEMAGDQRNVLLTLARILVTAETGRIVAKDVAADVIANRLSGQDRAVLALAGRDYVEGLGLDWSRESYRVRAAARTLVGLIDVAAPGSVR